MAKSGHRVDLTEIQKYMGHVHWEVVVNRWRVGFVIRNSRAGWHSAVISGTRHGEEDPLRKEKFATREAARDAIVAEFERRLNGTTGQAQQIPLFSSLIQ
jgi:hypothetical protein